MNDDVRELVRRKMTESLGELHPLVAQMTDIITKAYETGFWTGFNLGVAVEPSDAE